MLTYSDFCSFYSFNGCTNNLDAQQIFEYLCMPKNIHSMIIFSDLELPAISGIALKLESHFANLPNFSLTDYRKRQIVGRMIKFILSHFGYYPIAGGLDERAKLRNFSKATLFKTASVYQYQTDPAPLNSLLINIV